MEPCPHISQLYHKFSFLSTLMENFGRLQRLRARGKNDSGSKMAFEEMPK